MSETPKNRKGGPVFGYLAIMFAAAFLMLLLAYFIQQRNNEVAMDDLKDSVTFFESMDELVEDNRQLREELDSREQELDDLQKQLDTLQETLDTTLEEQKEECSRLEEARLQAQNNADAAQTELLSWAVFWDAEQLYRQESYEACAEVVRSWGISTFYVTPEAAKDRAKEIFDHLVSLELLSPEDLVWSLFQ